MRESTADPPTSRLVSGFRLSGVLIARRGAACNQSINGAPPPFLDGCRRTGGIGKRPVLAASAEAISGFLL